jgi:hypothetical protein
MLPPRIGRWKAAKQRAARCSQSKPATGKGETAPVALCQVSNLTS